MKVKKVLILVLTILITNVIFAQTFTINNIRYKVTSNTPRTVEVNDVVNNYNPETITIPETVTNNGIEYTVTRVGDYSFAGCDDSNYEYSSCPCNTSNLKNIILPSTITSIGYKAFICCINLENITIPTSVNTIKSFAFWGCSSLTSIVIPEGVTSIGERTFRGCSSLTSVTLPSTLTSIGPSAFKNCSSLTNIVSNATAAPSLGADAFYGTSNSKTITVPMGSTGYGTWGVSAQMTNYVIKQNEVHSLSTTFEINSERKLINDGVLVIEQGGELINNTSDNNLGIIEIETPSLTKNTWNFIGAPLTGTDGKYKLETIIPGEHDVSVSVFDYYDEGAGAWSTYWADIDTLIGEGEGFLVWPFADGKIAFSNYGDGMYSPNAHSTYSQYTYTGTPIYALNNENVVVSKTVVASPAPASGYWMALANPYTFRLNIATFLNNNTSIYNNQSQGNGSQIQGRCIYKLNSDNTFSPDFSGALNVTEGFFVNFASAGAKTITFNKNQRYTGNAKALVQRDFVKLTMIDGENESELFFACNEEAKQGYDIFDANKLFSLAEVTEPYFLTNEIPLVKEEVKSLPYYATMNVKSFRNKEVSFKATNVPEGVTVSIIDGGEIIDLSEDVVYTTNISAGENANRFKVVFKNSVGLLDIKEWDIDITNNNRNVNVSSTENDLQIEVYNALGQKVYETKDYNFTLNQVSAGAYIIKAFNNKINESMKIIVK
ncbi:MAG: leucine-rich repeat domain-containing protein [Bacteroidales bacterium]|nr:leucine-rich repeat domain-containing protein [Bacteroidales bacterium]